MSLPKGDVHDEKEVVQVQTHGFSGQKYTYFEGQNTHMYVVQITHF